MTRSGPARPRAGQRLGPNERLRAGWEYRRVYDAGRAYHGRFVVIFVARAPEFDRRAGFVAGRKVGPAVDRNRARRLLREAYRRLKSGIPPEGARLVLVAKKECAEQTLEAVSREVVELLRRAGFSSSSLPGTGA